MACFEAIYVLPSMGGKYRSMKVIKGTIMMSIVTGYVSE